MVQAAGLLLMLFGAIFFHIAAANMGVKSIPDLWKETLKIFQGG